MKQRPPMMNRKLLTIVTTALVLLALLLYRRPQNQTLSQPAASDEPETCVTAMLQAAQNGDVEAYLNCFAGDLRNKLKSRLAGRPAEQVAAELQTKLVGLTGQTTTDLEFQDQDRATLVHERLFTEEKEVYRASLQRIESKWRIVELRSLGRVALEIPVGTPVFVPAPDDEPVPENSSGVKDQDPAPKEK